MLGMFDSLFRDHTAAMCLADPAQTDCPVVACNDSFCRLTGYERSDILGHNCRFLQGPSTRLETIALIREAIAAPHSISICLTNYRANGQAFDNFLNITTLRTPDDALYFLGCQCEMRQEQWRDDIERRMAMLQDMSTGSISQKLSPSALDRFSLEARSIFASARSHFAVQNSERLIDISRNLEDRVIDLRRRID